MVDVVSMSNYIVTAGFKLSDWEMSVIAMLQLVEKFKSQNL